MLTISSYRLTTQLYESANSLIYRGFRLSDKQPVVLKMLKDKYPTPERIAWFKREYEVTRSLKISGVVNVYTLLRDSERLVMVLEDFGGDSLALLGLAGQLKLSEFFKLTLSITKILGQIHVAKIIHKDINPSNIVLNPTTEQVKIIDFGISTVLSGENLTFSNPNVLEGTLAYISPEQTGRMNRVIDYRTDFYSLGVTCYNLLTGQLPFQSEDALELVHSHIAKQPRPLQELKPELPPIVSDIVLKLMAKDAEERYQSAYGLIADLETCLNQLMTKGQIDIFPLGRQDISDRFQIPQKLYGRECEIEKLLAAFQRVSNGSSEMVLVAGSTGVGKSVFVREVYKLITAQRGNFISGKFDQYQRSSPYYALSQAFNELCQQLLTESETILNQWQEKIRHAVNNNGQVLINAIPNLERVIGSQPSVTQLGAQEAQNRFNLVFQSFIKAICQREHPLVLFIDDLQWADGGTLGLLRTIMSDINIRYLLIIGAYRDNEVDELHPLKMTIDAIKKEQGILSDIQLNNLQIQDVNALIAETLDCQPIASQTLTNLVYEKTQGNAFFTTEFLKSLNNECLLTFNHKVRKWQWNIAQIQAKDVTDNVVELMANKIANLATKTQNILQLAACIGNKFDLSTLGIIHQHKPYEVLADLLPALQEGLVFPLDNKYKLIAVGDEQIVSESSFKFQHDRVQQAAYTLIDETQRTNIHLQIGRLLLQNTEMDVLSEKIFEIVHHLNLGVELVINQQERNEVAKLNLIAGQKAKAATVYGAAIKYLHMGRELLSIDSWQNSYDLTLALYEEAAAAAYLKGDFEQMEQLVLVVQQQAVSLLHKMKVYEVRIQAFIAQKKQSEGLEFALQILQLLGVKFPASPSQADIMLGLQETQLALEGKEPSDLIDLPEMTDSYQLAVMRILSTMNSIAYQVFPALFPLIIFKQINLSLTYGNAAVSAFAYANYGIVLCGVGEFDSGYEVGQLALRMLERFKNKRYKTRTWLAVYGLIFPWKKHVRETLQPLLETYQTRLETGDLEHAAYCLDRRSYGLFFTATCNLVELEREMKNSSNALTQLNQAAILNYHEIFRQAVLNLLERSVNPCRLIGESYNEEKMLPLHVAENQKNAIFFLYLNKLILCYLFKQKSWAVRNAALAESYLDDLSVLLVVSWFYFYDSLAWLAIYANAAAPQQEQIIKKVSANQEKMKKWADHAPMNHLHKFYLVDSDLAPGNSNVKTKTTCKGNKAFNIK